MNWRMTWITTAALMLSIAAVAQDAEPRDLTAARAEYVKKLETLKKQHEVRKDPKEVTDAFQTEIDEIKHDERNLSILTTINPAKDIVGKWTGPFGPYEFTADKKITVWAPGGIIQNTVWKISGKKIIVDFKNGFTNTIIFDDVNTISVNCSSGKKATYTREK